mgnify:CR=1 FL=1
MPEEAPFVLRPVPLPGNLDEVLDDGVTRRSQLSLSHFADLVGTEVMVVGANAATPFTLVEAVEKPRSQYPGQKRMPFRLIFRGPKSAHLAGEHFDIRHPRLGLIPYLLLSRTLSYPDEPEGAYYQIAFV